MEKKLIPFGTAARRFVNTHEAVHYTYTDKDGNLTATPFGTEDNPYILEFLNAKNILEIGCGIGRNVPYILNATQADYCGIDPNISMLENFWKVNYRNPRVHISKGFNTRVRNIKFDYIISTFVFQHITYRPQGNIMNIDDITQYIMKNLTHENTVWFLLEHENEELDWQKKWMKNNNIEPTVYIKNWRRYPELLDRGDHNLIIFKQGKK